MNFSADFGDNVSVSDMFMAGVGNLTVDAAILKAEPRVIETKTDAFIWWLLGSLGTIVLEKVFSPLLSDGWDAFVANLKDALRCFWR